MINRLIDYILKGTKLMATLAEFVTNTVASANAITAALSDLDLKLDDVKAKIDALVAGEVLTQADKDAITAALDLASTKAAAVLAEGTGLATS